MLDFTFHNPVKIVFGKGKTELIGEHTAPFGKRVMLLYGRESARKSGLLGRVGASLQAAGVDFVERGGVRANPVLSFTRESIELFRAEKLDAIVALGGGSVIDSAKAIAAGVLYDGDVWDFFSTGKRPEEACPITTVLTLAATASEMNSGCVITNEETEQKFGMGAPCLFPRVSILDPVNTFSVPPDQSMFGAVDAIAHLLEAYLTGRDGSFPLQDRLVEGLILSIMETADVIRREPENYDARANLMWAATLALNGLTQAGVRGHGFPNHMIEHSLSALYDIAHGAGLAIVIPAWMKQEAERDAAKIAQLGRRVFERTGDDVAAAAGCIESLEGWFREIDVPVRLDEVDIPADDVERIAANAVMLAKLWGMGKDYDQTRIADVLHRAI